MGYILVNPRLNNSSINSKKKSQSEAAEDIWSQLSSNIKNYTPKFYFTIQEHKHKHKYDDDDSSSSSSSSDEELVFTFPAGKTQKNFLSLTYYPTIYGVPNVVLPTFATTFAPFVNVRLLPNILFF
jgi:hypothetical protein